MSSPSKRVYNPSYYPQQKAANPTTKHRILHGQGGEFRWRFIQGLHRSRASPDGMNVVRSRVALGDDFGRGFFKGLKGVTLQ